MHLSIPFWVEILNNSNDYKLFRILTALFAQILVHKGINSYSDPLVKSVREIVTWSLSSSTILCISPRSCPGILSVSQHRAWNRSRRNSTISCFICGISRTWLNFSVTFTLEVRVAVLLLLAFRWASVFNSTINLSIACFALCAALNLGISCLAASVKPVW